MFEKASGLGWFLVTSKALDARRREADRGVSGNTPQGGANEGNPADGGNDALMVIRISILPLREKDP